MIYILYGVDCFLIEREINEIKNKLKLDELGISNYNLAETSFKEIIEDANTYSLFDSKMIVCDNAIFLSGKGELPQDLDILEEYIKNPNPNTTIIIVVPGEKLDERKKIVKILKQKTVIKECNLQDSTSYIKSELKDYKMDDIAIREFKSRVGTDFSNITNELEKLKLYKFDEKIITIDDVKNLTVKTVSLDIFKFIDDIILRKKKEALEEYQEFLKRGTEPIAIIVMLANQIRIMYQSKQLSNKGYFEADIAKKLNIHPFRVKKALEKGYMYSSENLLTNLVSLANLDIEIKKGLKNKDLALELFILNM